MIDKWEDEKYKQVNHRKNYTKKVCWKKDCENVRIRAIFGWEKVIFGLKPGHCRVEMRSLGTINVIF